MHFGACGRFSLKCLKRRKAWTEKCGSKALHIYVYILYMICWRGHMKGKQRVATWNSPKHTPSICEVKSVNEAESVGDVACWALMGGSPRSLLLFLLPLLLERPTLSATVRWQANANVDRLAIHFTRSLKFLQCKQSKRIGRNTATTATTTKHTTIAHS